MVTDWDAVNREIEELRAENTRLRAAVEALQRVFEQGEADSKRAVERWRAKHPDRADEWPEKTDLLVFVMEQLDEVEAGEDFFMSAKLRTPRDPM